MICWPHYGETFLLSFNNGLLLKYMTGHFQTEEIVNYNEGSETKQSNIIQSGKYHKW